MHITSVSWICTQHHHYPQVMWLHVDDVIPSSNLTDNLEQYVHLYMYIYIYILIPFYTIIHTHAPFPCSIYMYIHIFINILNTREWLGVILPGSDIKAKGHRHSNVIITHLYNHHFSCTQTVRLTFMNIPICHLMA